MQTNGDGGSRDFDLRDGLEELRETIAHLGLEVTTALGDILEKIEGLKATSALLEVEYVDPDYRDEFVHYYAFTYRSLPTRCARLHFFRRRDGGDHYLGFCVLRPIGEHPVCRTMIVPPDELERYVSCTVSTTVHPLGRELQVRGFPFMEQDAQYGSCAHASIWMVSLYHHLAHGAPRRLMSDITRGAAARTELLRTAPSQGLSKVQVGAALQHLGLDPIVYDTAVLGARSSIAAAACRYLNSALPVILATPGHATVLVGYGRDVDVLLSDRGSDSVPELPLGLRVRTYVMRAREYKVGIEKRGLSEDLREIYRVVGTPSWVWVVELQDVALAQASQRCVIGEVAFDATSSNASPSPAVRRTSRHRVRLVCNRVQAAGVSGRGRLAVPVRDRDPRCAHRQARPSTGSAPMVAASMTAVLVHGSRNNADTPSAA